MPSLRTIPARHARHARPTARPAGVARPGAAPARPDRTPLLAGGLILLAVALHLAYLLIDCPLDLAPDEAHYWHWSRRLDWGYYSKGPLVAWLIRGSCELFGPLSVSLVGTEAAAVRLPAVLCHGLLLAALYTHAAETLRNRRQALAVVALAFALPPLSAGAILMTIDAPFLACWGWALAFAWRAVGRGGVRWWLLAGACGGLGVLAKFTMLLFPAAVAAYLLADRGRRGHFRRPGFWLMALLTGGGCAPVLAWNAAHDWVSLRHVLGQIDGSGGTGWAPLTFLGGQLGFLVGYWFVAFAAAAWAYRPARLRRPEDADLAFLWWLSVPVWGVFLVAGLRSTGQVNWPAAAYLAGFPLAVAWAARQLRNPTPWHRRLAAGSLAAAVAAGLALAVAIHYPDLYFRPLLARVVGPPTADRPTPCAASTRRAGFRAGARSRPRWTRSATGSKSRRAATRSSPAWPGRCRGSWASTAAAGRRRTRWAWPWRTGTASTTSGGPTRSRTRKRSAAGRSCTSARRFRAWATCSTAWSPRSASPTGPPGGRWPSGGCGWATASAAFPAPAPSRCGRGTEASGPATAVHTGWWIVGSWEIGCGSCRMKWFRVGACSAYERQAIESRPCPGCGLYTMTCTPPKPAAGRRRPMPAPVPNGYRRAG